MIAYYLPELLTCETIIMYTEQPSPDYKEIETEKLYELGFKKAVCDGEPYNILKNKLKTINGNGLYLQIYKNTRQQKWLSKIDTGKLLIPISLQAKGIPKKLYRKRENKLYTVAFINKQDFLIFNKNQKYNGYRLVQGDRTDHYIVDGIIINP